MEWLRKGGRIWEAIEGDATYRIEKVRLPYSDRFDFFRLTRNGGHLDEFETLDAAQEGALEDATR